MNLKLYGFDDYMIDFSDVTPENTLKLCEFIKNELENENKQIKRIL